jgi:Fe-S cluster biogenesis protein NfuA
MFVTHQMNLIERIENALNQLRPYLETDGGNVRVIDVTSEMILRLQFSGACSSCSMSAMTLRAGIEQTVLKMVPEIKSVVALSEEELLND